MMKESRIHKIVSFIHLIFIISLFLGITTVVSGGILFLPALTAVFYLGKELIYKRYNVYDGLIKILFTKVIQHIRILRFLPVEILFIMQCIGFYMASMLQMKTLQIILLSSGAFLFVYLLYICGYEIFIGKDYTWFKVIIAMFYRINYLISLWIFTILVMLFMQLSFIKFFIIAGGLVVLTLEILVFLSLISFKQALGLLEDDEKEMPVWFEKINSRINNK